MSVKELLKMEPEGLFSIVICPCCGKETLDNHYVCRCGWEYDGITDETKYSDANRSTIKEFKTR